MKVDEAPSQSLTTAALPRALLICDVVDSTRLVEDLGDRTAAALWERHDRLARDLLAAYGGREIDKTDGFLFLFERPWNAVAYALAYHRGLEDLSRDSGPRMAARAGVHFGEVVLRENAADDVARGAKPLEVEGLAKVVAARLMSLARGGQTLLTRGAFDMARRAALDETSADTLRWLAHGDYLLQGIHEPVTIYEVGVEGRAPLVAPTGSAKARRADVQRAVAGWRPAPGLVVPRRAHWQLERRLGEGSFGEGWLAVHRKTGERRVFKFCHDAASLRSLEREITLFRLLKETLGLRDDICRILDWSFDEAPYFIESEFTAEGSLADWVAERGGLEEVPLGERLEIVAQVATALAAAHSVGVLHKDVKPSNVLVASAPDGTVQAQLCDFGIGAVTDHERLVDAGITVLGITLETEGTSRSSLTGTRLYIAPELLEGKPATLQADIYALGVLLYQVVVGDFSRALAPGWRDDVDDELLAEDIAAAAHGSSEKRLRDASQLAERLRTLEARRAERKAALEARRAAERSAKQRRVMAAVIVALVVLGGLMSWMNLRVAREAETSRKVSEFLVRLFEATDPYDTADPGKPRGTTMTVQELLERGVDRLESDLADQPVIRARLMNTLGVVHRNLGLFDEAERLLSAALELRGELYGDDHVEVAESLNDLGQVLLEKGDYAAAEPLLERALGLQRRLLGEGPEVAASLTDLATLLQSKGDYAAAEELFRQALEMTRRLSDDDQLVANGMNNLALVLQDLGKTDEAEPLLRESLARVRKHYGDDHPIVAISLNNLSGLYVDRGDFAEAEALVREAQSIFRRLLEDEHPQVALGWNNLAWLLYTQGEYEAAEPLYREALAIRRRIHGEVHPDVSMTETNLALLLQARGDLRAAESLFRRVLDSNRQLLGDEHPRVALDQVNLAGLLQDQGDYSAAEPLYLEALSRQRRLLGDEHPAVAFTRRRLATFYEKWGRPQKALEPTEE